MTLDDFFKEHPKTAIAFSGGADSAYLLYAAARTKADFCAYYVRSAFQPEFELEHARRLAKDLGVRLRILSLDVLCNPKISSNPPNRCYYCKRAIFSRILQEAKKDGYPIVLDGTNHSDDAADRPGMQALTELSVRSPLRECGVTKADVRRLSKEAGLFTWDKPAYACLATRIPTGLAITKELLTQTETAENFLKQSGFSDFRVRILPLTGPSDSTKNRINSVISSDIQEGDPERPQKTKSGVAAKIEIQESQLPLLLEKRQEILQELKPYYDRILLDLEVRNEPN